MPNLYNPGRLRSQGAQIVTKTAAYTATNDDDMILVDCTSGAVTIALPAASTAVTSAGNQNKLLVIKKIDSSANAVTISGTIDGATNYHLVRQNEIVELASNGSAWYLMSTDANEPRLLARVSVPVYTSAVTTLFTVPTGKTLKITDLQLECTEAQAAGTSTTTKIGTSSGSYAELLNGSTGLVQTTATATTCLVLGSRVNVFARYSTAINNAQAKRSYAAGTVIGISCAKSGSPTKGTLAVDLYGFLS